MLNILSCDGTLCILNRNIIEYVLNLYLDYEEDIIKVKLLYNKTVGEFNIKPHLKQKKFYGSNGNLKMLNIYLDYNLIKKYEWYGNKEQFIIENYKNNKLHGIQKYWLTFTHDLLEKKKIIHYFIEGVKIY
jgi:hypothetical protein